MHNIFVYGSLRDERVVEALFNSTYEMVDAYLPGYKRVRIEDHPAPGLAIDDKHRLSGKIIFNLDENSKNILDRFEAENGFKTGDSQVQVVVKRDGFQELKHAFVYNYQSENKLTSEELFIDDSQESDIGSVVEFIRENRTKWL